MGGIYNPPAAASPNFVRAAAKLSSAGTLQNAYNCTYVKLSTGNYRFTFTSPIDSNSQALVNVQAPSGTTLIGKTVASTQSSTSIDVQISDLLGVATDSAMSLVMISAA